MYDHSYEKHERKHRATLFCPAANSPARVEYHGEHKGIHAEHEERAKKGPAQPQYGTSVAAYHLPTRHLPYQPSVLPQTRHACEKRYRVGGVGIHEKTSDSSNRRP